MGGLVDGGAGGGHLGQLGLDVVDMPVGGGAGEPLRPAARDQPDVLAGDVEPDVPLAVGGRLGLQQGGVELVPDADPPTPDPSE